MANNTNRIAGTAFFNIDGANYPARGEFKYFAGTVSRETVTGLDGVHGYMEKPSAPYIEGVLTNSGGLSIQILNSITNSTITLQLANGKTVIGRNMWATDPQEADVDEGKVKFRVEGLQGAVSEFNS